MQYITVDKVNEILGADWQGSGNAEIAVMQANAWLNAKNLQGIDEDNIPSEVSYAGALLAKQAANGSLYADKGAVVAEKTVSAQTGTSVSKKFVPGKEEAVSGDMQFILDLLAPWLKTDIFAINTFVVTE